MHGTVATRDGGATGLSCAPGVAARMASLASEDRDEDTRTGQRDFFNTNPDGTLIRLFGDFAIIHARTTYRNSDGSEGGGRYTDEAAAGAPLAAPIAIPLAQPRLKAHSTLEKSPLL